MEQGKTMDTKMEKMKEMLLPVIPASTSTAAFLLLKKNLGTWDYPDVYIFFFNKILWEEQINPDVLSLNYSYFITF